MENGKLGKEGRGKREGIKRRQEGKRRGGVAFIDYASTLLCIYASRKTFHSLSLKIANQSFFSEKAKKVGEKKALIINQR